MVKEADVQQWVRRNLITEFGDEIYIFKVPQGQYTSRRGIPDLVMAIRGLFVAIEVKTEIGKLTKLQQHEIQQIHKSGALAYTIYGKDKNELRRIINTIREHIWKLRILRRDEAIPAPD